MAWSVEILNEQTEDIEYYIAVGGEREARTYANEQKSLGRIILAIKDHAGNLTRGAVSQFEIGRPSVQSQSLAIFLAKVKTGSGA